MKYIYNSSVKDLINNVKIIFYILRIYIVNGNDVTCILIIFAMYVISPDNIWSSQLSIHFNSVTDH